MLAVFVYHKGYSVSVQEFEDSKIFDCMFVIPFFNIYIFILKNFEDKGFWCQFPKWERKSTLLLVQPGWYLGSKSNFERKAIHLAIIPVG